MKNNNHYKEEFCDGCCYRDIYDKKPGEILLLGGSKMYS